MKKLLSGLFILSLLFFTVASSAMAATIRVTSGSTDELTTNNSCSVREAIINTNYDKSTYLDCKPILSTTYGDDTIIIPAGTYCLGIPNSDADSTVPTSGTDEEFSKTGDLDITGNLTISGAGADNTIIDAGGGSDTDCTALFLDRVIESAKSTTVSISDVTITGGNLIAATSSADGGGIYTNSDSTLTLTDSTVSGNTATSNSFDVEGGGIYLSSGATLTNSTVSDNSATSSDSHGYGGGVYVSSGAMTFTNSTVSNNSATSSIDHAFGGGVYIYSATTMIFTNSTVSENTATTDSSYAKGGGIYASFGGSTPTLSSSTVSGNSAISSSDKAYGGGIYVSSNINIKSTILSNNNAQGSMASYGAECYSGGTWNSYGYNFIADASASTSDNCALVYTTSLADSSTDITTKTHEALLLSELADNDGDTDTHALKSGSPAIDTGSCTDIDGNSMTTDQRGSSRPVDGDGDDTVACDIGPYEYQITCGDGVKAGSETCDDSNTLDNDGCSYSCILETLYYQDGDGDTYGNSSVTKNATSLPTGYVTDSTDCDDADASVYPGADEVANDGIDQDCDGEDAYEEVCLDVITNVYADTDGDGYGDPDVSSYLTDSCDAMPDGYVSNNEDCDDSDALVYPGADEVADDGIDQDCSGADSTSSSLDSDGDGVVDAKDAFPNDAGESVDTDDDGIGDNADTDDDNDGTPDTSDADDGDSDGDGVPDTEEETPEASGSDDETGGSKSNGGGGCSLNAGPVDGKPALVIWLFAGVFLLVLRKNRVSLE